MSNRYVGMGLAIGAGIGAALGSATGEMGTSLAFGIGDRKSTRLNSSH